MRKLGLIIYGSIVFCSQLIAQDYKLVWEENFDGNTLDPKTWSIETGEGIWNTGSNSELQHYRSENVAVGDDGEGNNCLIITAKKEAFKNYAFTSGKIESKGKFTFKYGKLVARIKIPDLANGLWPAFWTIGNIEKGWPDCGEIDILEMGHADGIKAGTQNKHHGGALHWENANNYAGYGRADDAKEDLNKDFHLFTLEWTPNSVKTFLDDNTSPYFEMNISGEDLEEFKEYTSFIIFNMAVGGQFPSIYSDEEVTAPFPAKMYVDYVKLYQKDGEGEMSTSTKVIGNFGAYTETASTFQKLDYNFDGVINSSNLTNNADENPKEGDEVLAFFTQPGKEFTLIAGSKSSLNMLNYKNGSISAYIKTNIVETIKLGISDGTNTSYVELNDLVDYNVKRDNTWNRILIPMADFADNIDFSKIKDFLIVNGATSGTNSISIDNVVWFENFFDSNYLGLYTENPNILEKVEVDNTNIFLYVWENSLSFLENKKAYEGEAVMALKDNGIGWYGLGLFSSTGIDATAFNDGYFIFTLKTTCTSNFWIGIGGANDTDGKVVFNYGNDPSGFKRDGMYHTLIVPMADLNAFSMANYNKPLDLSACGNVLMFGGDKGLTEIEMDDIYLSNSQTPVENPLIAVLKTISVTPANTTIKVGKSVKLSAKGLDQLGGTIEIDPEWSASNGGFITELGEFVGITPGTYTITAQANGISGTATVIVENATAIKNNQKLTYHIYPNPATEIITIQSNESIHNIKILDITGKPLNNIDITNEKFVFSINLESLSNGVYLVNVTSHTGNHAVQKIVKKN